MRRHSRAIEPLTPACQRAAHGARLDSEIKHDGFRIMARRDDNGVRLFMRNGYNFAPRFPMIVAALESLSVRSCFIDGEAIVVDRNGLPVFDLLRYRQHDPRRCPMRVRSY